MKNLVLARRYANALLLIAREDEKVDEYRQELLKLDTVFEANPEFKQMLFNPLYARLARRKLLGEVLKKLELSKVMLSFVFLLFDKGRLPRLADIRLAYQQLADQFQNIARAKLVSAVDLSDSALEDIRLALAKKIDKNLILSVEKDRDIIGGIITRVGDLVYDGSIRTQLRNLRESFKRGEGI